MNEYQKMNWAPLVLGFVIVGPEAGWIYAYKAGWQVSTGFLVGVGICLVGLVFIS